MRKNGNRERKICNPKLPHEAPHPVPADVWLHYCDNGMKNAEAFDQITKASART
jgi:hypothetical protein